MYCQFYRFSAKPFENTPDPDFLFLPKNHREVLASLSYGINAGKGFMLVVGDVGTGKTTLIHALIKQIDRNFLIIHIINPRTSFQEIVQHMCRKLEINPNGLSGLELVEAIREKLITLDKDGVRLVLIIDEAHHLTREALEEIRLISNIESEKKKLIQIALVGQIELYRTLQHDNLRQLRQRIVLSRSLTPLDKRETFDYIQHRLNVAGRRDQIFSTRALNLIWEKSKGIPRVINQLCDNALVIGLALDATTIGPKIIKEAIHDMESGRELLKDAKRPLFLSWKLVGAIAVIGCLILLSRLWDVGQLVPFHRTSINGPTGCGEGKLRDSGHKEIEAVSVRVAKGKEVEVGKERQDDVSITSTSSSTEPGGDSFRSDGRKEVGKVPAEKPEEKGIEAGKKKQDDVLSASNSSSAEQGAHKFSGDGHKEVGKTSPEKPEEKGIELGKKGQDDIFLGPKELDIPEHVHDPESKRESERKKVKQRDYLAKIAWGKYGIANDTVYDLIQMANPEIQDVDLIYADQEIMLPCIRRKDLIVKDEKGSYYIHYASFYSFEKARDGVQELQSKKQQVFLFTVLMGKELIYRIYIGLFEDYSEAKKEAQEIDFKYLPFLKSEGLSPAPLGLLNISGCISYLLISLATV